MSTEDPEQPLRAEHSHSAEVLPPPLSSDLAALRLSSAGRSMTVDELQVALKGRGGGNAPSSARAAVLPDSGARFIDPIWHRCPADRHPDRVSTEAVVAQIYPATENFSAPPCESAHRRHSVRQTNGEGRKAPDAFSAFGPAR